MIAVDLGLLQPRESTCKHGIAAASAELRSVASEWSRQLILEDQKRVREDTQARGT